MALGELIVEFVGQCMLEALSYLTGRAVGADPERAREVGFYVLLALVGLLLLYITLTYS